MAKNDEVKKFEKPGLENSTSYPNLAKIAITNALKDAKIDFLEIQQAIAAYVYGDSTSGQRALYEVGMTGIPVYNVNNNCSTGSTALYLSKQLIETGVNDCILAFGFEQMERGSLSSKYFDRANPLEKHVSAMSEVFEITEGPLAAQIFGNAGVEHMRKFGTTPEHFAKIAYKNHKHSVNNPYSQFRDEYTLEQIKTSPKIHDFLTKLQCCPTSNGAGAAVIASEKFVRIHNLEEQAVEIIGMEMATDFESSFNSKSAMKIAGYDMTKFAAERLFAAAKCKPNDVHVVELHDCFSANELITYEALGLCAPGTANELIDSKNNTYGGKYVVNPSGGLISKGHPLGATGFAQCAELCWQLRGVAGLRQVPNCKLALQHNLGLGGAVVVALYRLGFQKLNEKVDRITTHGDGAGSSDGFNVTPVLHILRQAMQEDEDNLIDKFRAIYKVIVTNGPNGKTGTWIINAKTGRGNITFNGTDKPDVTIIVNDNDIVELISGSLEPQKAFLQGKIKIKGNLMIALKLMDLKRIAHAKIESLKSKL